MKLRNIFAAATAISMVAVTAISASAAVFGGSDEAGQFVCLVSNDSNTPVLKNPALAGDITKVVVTVECADYRDLESTIAAAEWYGGGMGTNSTSTGWAQTEWSFQEGVKPLTFVPGDSRKEYVVTWEDADGFFTDSEEYAFFWIQDWTGTYSFTITDYQLLNADGVDVRTLDGAVEEPEAPAEEPEAPVEEPEEPVEEPEEPVEEPEEPVEEPEEPAEEPEEPAEEPEEPAEEPEEPAEEPTEEPAGDKTSPDTGVAGVAAIAGVAALAGAAVVVSRKRK